jgi:hypothetical protein
MTSVSSNSAPTQGLSEPSVSEASPASLSAEQLASLADKLCVESPKAQLQLIRDLAAAGEPGRQVLLDFLLSRRSQAPTIVDGSVYQVLLAHPTDLAFEDFQAQFPQGLLPTPSKSGVDYQPLQQALAAQEFQTADRLTLQALCELAGETAVQRKWLYFSEVKHFPVEDLQTIDTLWRIYSEGKFGFSVQRQLWLSAGKNWDTLWVKIGWKSGNEWTRYPNGFTWNLTAPTGHLPLSNQLRGVQVLASLFNHPAWNT